MVELLLPIEGRQFAWMYLLFASLQADRRRVRFTAILPTGVEFNAGSGPQPWHRCQGDRAANLLIENSSLPRNMEIAAVDPRPAQNGSIYQALATEFSKRGNTAFLTEQGISVQRMSFL